MPPNSARQLALLVARCKLGGLLRTAGCITLGGYAACARSQRGKRPARMSAKEWPSDYPLPSGVGVHKLIQLLRFVRVDGNIRQRRGCGTEVKRYSLHIISDGLATVLARGIFEQKCRSMRENGGDLHMRDAIRTLVDSISPFRCRSQKLPCFDP